MQISIVTLVLAAATSTIAAPATSMMAAVPEWSIENFTRTCSRANTRCLYSFTIDTNDGRRSRTRCSYTSRGKEANRATVGTQKCGDFIVTSSWSDQFGEENGFTTLAVKNGELIVWPAYADSEIENGKRVSPDKSYAPQKL